MKPITVDAFEIPASKGLDSIRVIFHDTAPGAGRIIIECFGAAWSAYWGAMGDRTVRQFVNDVEADYLAMRLWPSNFRRTKLAEAYLLRIAEAVKAAIKESEVAA